MKLALHQPYFFPYIGYYAVLYAADIYVHSDTMQYMRHSWVNRNRILCGESKWKYITVPIKKSDYTDKIIETEIDYGQAWEEKIMAQMTYYKKKAPYYKEIIGILEKTFSRKYENIAELNIAATDNIMEYLGRKKDTYRLSKLDIDTSWVQEPDEWGIAVCKNFDDVDCYLNAPGGKELYDVGKYEKNDLDIKFLQTNLQPYQQSRQPQFIEGLSILDVLMFNSVENVQKMLHDYIYI